MNKLKDKITLITGAGKGSGRLLAKAIAKRGAIVAANDISPVNVEEINKSGGQAKAFIEDVAKKVGAQHLIKQVEDEFGHIDILINHASVRPHASLLNMDEWDWHRVLDVNMTGTFLMTQSAGRVMRASSPKGDGAFVASIQGLEGFTRQAALELNPYGIQVHAVETGEGILERVFALFEEKS